MRTISAPPADRALIDRSADLCRARGADWAFRLMKRETPIVPGQPAMRNDSPRLPLKIRDHVLVADVKDTARRQDATPMRHEPLVTPIIAPKLAEVVGMILYGSKKPRIAGQACVDWIANGMNDFRVRQSQMNQSGKVVIGRHFVGHAFAVGRQSVQLRNVTRADLPERRRTER